MVSAASGLPPVLVTSGSIWALVVARQGIVDD
jgi:hypothetical protein